MKLRIGIIGAGRIGKLHAENLAYRIPNAEPAAITDIDIAAAQETAAKLSISKVVADYHEILDDKNINAILICSSTDTHAQFIEAAAQAGKHVFCEKPIDLELNRIRKVLEIVKRADIKFQVGFNRRFDPNFVRIRKAVQQGEIGAPHILRITSRDPEPPPLAYLKTSGGLFLDMAIHDFDMARFLTGAEIEEVYACGSVLLDPSFEEAKDIDTATVTLKFDSGAIGVIDNSRKAVYGYDQRVEVFGSKGMVRAENNAAENVQILDADSGRSPKPLYFFLERYKDSYVAEIQAFVDAILGDHTPPVGGTDGLESIRLGLAAKQSLAENRPVKVSDIQ